MHACRSTLEDPTALHLLEHAGATLLVPKPDESWDEEHDAHRPYDFLHDLHTQSRRNEALRLLYVAVTRARRTATLYLSAERDPLTGAAKIKSNSFAGALEPVIRAQVDRLPASAPAMPVVNAAAGLSPPRAPRLRTDFAMPVDTDLYRPSEIRTLRPSEAVLTAQEEPEARRDEGNLYAQLVGTLYHEAMQRIAGEGLAAWADAGESKRGSMAAGLRRRGMPEPLVVPAVDRVLALLARTLASEQGRWLVSPKSWARSEYPLAGLRDGRWLSAVIDRCFEGEDGRLWVIDYKTSAQPVTTDALDVYVSAGTTRYREQVGQYVKLLGALRPDREVRGALYFVDADRLVEIDP